MLQKWKFNYKRECNQQYIFIYYLFNKYLLVQFSLNIKIIQGITSKINYEHATVQQNYMGQFYEHSVEIIVY